MNSNRQLAFEVELQRRRQLLPLSIDSRSGRVGIVNVEGSFDGYVGAFEWELQIYGPRWTGHLRVNDQQLRQLADLVDQVLPKPKDPTVVRVELVQLTKGSRKKRRPINSAPPAAPEDEVSQIKRRMLEGR